MLDEVMSADVARLRQASRMTLRELGVLDTRSLPGGCTCAEAHALIEIERLGQLTVAELAGTLLLDKSTASRSASELVRRGLASKKRSPTDGRRKVLALTARGRKLLSRVNEAADRQVAEALSLLDDEARAGVVEGMETYSRTLSRGRQRSELRLRRMRRSDNPAVASVIRDVMTEFGAVGEGYSINDAEVQSMYEAYAGNRAAYFVVAAGKKVLGGAGVGPLAGGSTDTCELRKMYLRPELRGLGVGRDLMRLCLDAAVESGYRRCYLETLEHMSQARTLYEGFGFKPLARPMGNTTHCGCNHWYVKDLGRTWQASGPDPTPSPSET